MQITTAKKVLIMEHISSSLHPDCRCTMDATQDLYAAIGTTFLRWTLYVIVLLFASSEKRRNMNE